MKLRKGLIVLVLATLAAGGVFAQTPFSVSMGLGGFMGKDFGGGKLRMRETSKENPSLPIQRESDISILNLNMGVFLKCPIEIDTKTYLYPLVGAAYNYNMALSVKDADGNEHINFEGEESPRDFSAIWFNFGAGLDYSFNDTVYLRFEALYGIRLAAKYEKDLQNYLDDSFNTDPNELSWSIQRRNGHGVTAKLAIGFNLY
jgi:hypothetical protein